jgi:hypothetical protein
MLEEPHTDSQYEQNQETHDLDDNRQPSLFSGGGVRTERDQKKLHHDDGNEQTNTTAPYSSAQQQLFSHLKM